ERQLLRGDLTAEPPAWERLARKSDLVGQLANLTEQAGSRRTVGDILLIMAGVTVAAGVIGGWRTGSAPGAVLSALVGAVLPGLYLLHKRHRRVQRFQEHFPDAVDMMSRAIRAGNALSAAIQLVAEEMADPIGYEFRQVAEQIRLGLDPGEALTR